MGMSLDADFIMRWIRTLMQTLGQNCLYVLTIGFKTAKVFENTEINRRIKRKMANKVSENLEGLTNNFKGMIDANSVVGEPIIVNDGTMIVPISKVSFGFGGAVVNLIERKTILKSLDDKNFGGGMGGGASVDAMAFLVINNGNVRLIPMEAGSSPVDKLIDLVPRKLLDKRVNGFLRKDAKKAQKKAEENECADEIINQENKMITTRDKILSAVMKPTRDIRARA